ncbi:hypothetical protein PAPYR_12927 [Paratrimastix pyriformis]|uniref:Uncharacterized protein n=1 Tax=Paratrimastix pyriformis TaxID=342808 RepID=A0ABQ8U130_9EUKA|nr:hypothetical protein PAPYR_12927 [Paratrimastix pyriformis]
MQKVLGVRCPGLHRRGQPRPPGPGPGRAGPGRPTPADPTPADPAPAAPAPAARPRPPGPGRPAPAAAAPAAPAPAAPAPAAPAPAAPAPAARPRPPSPGRPGPAEQENSIHLQDRVKARIGVNQNVRRCVDVSVSRSAGPSHQTRDPRIRCFLNRIPVVSCVKDVQLSAFIESPVLSTRGYKIHTNLNDFSISQITLSALNDQLSKPGINFGVTDHLIRLC